MGCTIKHKKVKNYSIGLDIGTSSVGWAVIDDETKKVVQFNGKNMLGVRLFDSAQTAEKRRKKRNTRRLNRRKQSRILYLQELLAEGVSQEDPNFYIKMKYSSLLSKTSLEVDNNSFDNCYLFQSKKEQKEFNDKYPTIYHLRNELMSLDKKHSMREIYLACHHILKNRGHFLYNENVNFDFDDGSDIEIKDILKENLENIFSLLNNDTFKNIDDKFENMLDDLLNVGLSKTELKEKWKETKYLEIIKLLIGYKVDLKKLINLEDVDDESKELLKDSISLKEDNSEKDLFASDNQFSEIVELLEEAYSICTLKRILKGHKSISEAKIQQYEEYKKDLRDAKSIIKDIDKEKYKEIFKAKTCLYDKYTRGGGSEKDGKKRNLNYKDQKHIEEIWNIIIKKYYTEELKFSDGDKFDRSKLVEELKDEKIVRILDRIKNSDFLVLMNNSDNSVFPYQLHLKELEKILEIQSKYHELLDSSTIDKIVSLLKFRIPYYVGPLVKDTSKSENSWLVRKNNEKIRPWNFNEVVDDVESSINFIKRMTGKCSYLLYEDVLCKDSLLYTKYMVLSEINVLKNNVENTRITKDERDAIYQLFLRPENKGKDITKKMIDNELTYKFGKNNYDIVGFQKEDKCSNTMKAYQDFTKILNINNFNEKYNGLEKDIEQIILWKTILPSESIFEKVLRNSEESKRMELTEKQIKEVVKLKYSGWGRLSRKFLSGIRTKNQTTIIEELENSNISLNEILNNVDKDLLSKIDKLNSQFSEKESLVDRINKLHGSPAIKRGILQSFYIVKEIVKIMSNKKNDSKLTDIAIEVARSDEEKKRTKTRKNKLEDCYKKHKEKFKESKDELKGIEKELKDHETLLANNDRLYLYFLQHGKCLYTNTRLNINEINNDNVVEVDHIIPKSLLPIDSLDNKALVLKKCNQDKGDNQTVYKLLGEEKFNEMIKIWTKLKKSNCISESKYSKLTLKHLSDRVKEGFINRQLVETRQITRNVGNILNGIYPDVKVSLIKAGLIYDAKNNLKIYKNREVNDKHHSIDALMCAYVSKILKENPVLSNESVIDGYNKYISDIKNKYIKNKENYINSVLKYNLSAYNDQIIELVDTNNYRITYRLNKEENGELWHETIYNKNYKKSGIPIKKVGSSLGVYSNLYKKYLIVENNKLKDVFTYEKNNNDRIIYINQLIRVDDNYTRVKSLEEQNIATPFNLTNKELGVIDELYKNKDINEEQKQLIEIIKNRICVEYEYFLTDGKIKAIEDNFNIVKEKNEKDGYINFLENLFKVAKNSPARVKIWSGAGRYSKKINEEKSILVRRSVTGLFENEMSIKKFIKKESNKDEF